MPNSDVLANPGYTPAKKELGAVFDWLLDGDDATARLAERALISAGAATIELARSRLDAANAEQRVRLARFVGRLAQSSNEPQLDEMLLRLLADAEPRVLRGAAVAIGKLLPERARRLDAESALIACLPQRAGAERRAILEALGKIGGESARVALHAVTPEGDVEAQILARARLRLGRASVATEEADRVLLDAPLGRACTIALFHRRGLSEIVARQLLAVGPTQAETLEWRRLNGYRGSLAELFQARSLLAPAILLEVQRPSDDAAWAEAVVDAVCRDDVLDILERVTSTRPRLRFVLPKEGHQRALLWRISERLSERTDRVQANPKAALWEVQIDRGRLPAVFLVPRRYEDPRFTYRVREISGASHPTIAAALADVVQVRANDVIWDPFVGSGLELVECALRGPYRELIGTDNNPRALTAAEANLRAANVERVRLLNADARSARLEGITAIVTNPPLGVRHQRDGQLGPLLVEFLDNARRMIAPSGRIVWLSPLPQMTAQHARALGFQVERHGPVDVGGLSPELQVFRSPATRR